VVAPWVSEQGIVAGTVHKEIQNQAYNGYNYEQSVTIMASKEIGRENATNASPRELEKAEVEKSRNKPFEQRILYLDL